MPAPRPFRFDRSWLFAEPPEAIWAVLTRTDDFPRWWSWLRAFDAADGLAPGSSARCVIRGPLPYALEVVVDVETVEPARLLTACVRGDLTGPARLELEPAGDGCTTRLVWEVDLREPRLRAAAWFARPLLEWGHEWVVNTGVEQFRRRALNGQA